MILDHSSARLLETCARKFYYSAVRGWRPSAEDATARRFGSAYHALLAAGYRAVRDRYATSPTEAATTSLAGFDAVWVAEGLPDAAALLAAGRGVDVYTPTVLRGLVRAYWVWRWPLVSECEVLLVEEARTVPLDGEARYRWAAKLDVVLRRRDTGVLYPVDHKTTKSYSGSKRDPSSLGVADAVLREHALSAQFRGQALLARLGWPDAPLGGVLVDTALVSELRQDIFVSTLVEIDDAGLETFRREAVALFDGFEEAPPPVARYRRSTGACRLFGSICAYADLCEAGHFTASPDDTVFGLTEPPYGFVFEPWNPFEPGSADAAAWDAQRDRLKATANPRWATV